MSVIESLSNEVQNDEIGGKIYMSYFIDCNDLATLINLGPKVDYFGPDGYNTPPKCPT